MTDNPGYRYCYADPPYLGVCHRYGHRHEAPYGCWDDLDTHATLIEHLDEYDGWALSAGAPSLQKILGICPDDVRVAAWVKPFAAWKPGVRVAYCWEPVIWRGGRTRSDRVEPTIRDYLAAPMTLRRSTIGAKPERFCRWVTHLLGVQPGDELIDAFPGSG